MRDNTCVECESIEIRILETKAKGDGQILQTMECINCGWQWINVYLLVNQIDKGELKAH